MIEEEEETDLVLWGVHVDKVYFAHYPHIRRGADGTLEFWTAEWSGPFNIIELSVALKNEEVRQRDLLPSIAVQSGIEGPRYEDVVQVVTLMGGTVGPLTPERVGLLPSAAVAQLEVP